jgi:hypothetical protein
MRALVFAVAVAGCAPKVNPAPKFDDDLGSDKTAEAPAAPVEAPRLEAPKGAGLRSGTIARAKMLAVLDAGVPMFLRQFEVAPHMTGDRFIGWQLVQLVDKASPLVDLDVVPGDVVLAVNGKPLSRPDQLQTLWDSLRTANEVVAEMWRGDRRFELHFQVEPKL